MNAVMHYLYAGWDNFGPVFILLGLLVFVHELGHFLVARMCGVRVETFSLGFGKKLFKYKPGDTTYCISIVPLGGYVKMFGDDPSAEIPVEQRPYAFLHKPVGQRIAVVLAGPLMNLFFAAFLFMAIGRIGEEIPSARVGDVPEHSAAMTAGFHPGDKIVKIDGEAVTSWSDVQKKIEQSPGQSLNFDLERGHDLLHLVAPVLPVTNENILSMDRQVGGIDGLSNDSTSAVIGVLPMSPAALAGLHSLDLITEVNGKAVGSYSELAAAVQSSTGDLNLKVRDVDSEDRFSNDRPLRISGDSMKGRTMTDIGVEPAEMYILKVKPDSPAAKAGFTPKDRITAIDGKPVATWIEVLNKVKSFHEGDQPLQVTLHKNGAPADVSVALKPEMTSLMNAKGQEEHRYTIGVVSGSFKVGSELVTIQIKDPVKLVNYGVQQSIEWSGVMVMSIVRLVQGEVSAKNIGGIITIGRVASRSFEIGISSFLKTMALLSINLFLLNLLPVPVLDGGHLVFFTLEAVKGSPISLKKLAIAQQVGLTLLIMLMAYAFMNDITNLLSPHW